MDFISLPLQLIQSAGKLQNQLDSKAMPWITLMPLPLSAILEEVTKVFRIIMNLRVFVSRETVSVELLVVRRNGTYIISSGERVIKYSVL